MIKLYPQIDWSAGFLGEYRLQKRKNARYERRLRGFHLLLVEKALLLCYNKAKKIGGIRL